MIKCVICGKVHDSQTKHNNHIVKYHAEGKKISGGPNRRALQKAIKSCRKKLAHALKEDEVYQGSGDYDFMVKTISEAFNDLDVF